MADKNPLNHHDSVDDFRRGLIASHRRYTGQVEAYFAATLDSSKVPLRDAISDARDAASIAANVTYGLAAVLGFAARKFGDDVARELTGVAENVLMNGDDGDTPHNADVMSEEITNV